MPITHQLTMTEINGFQKIVDGLNVGATLAADDLRRALVALRKRGYPDLKIVVRDFSSRGLIHCRPEVTWGHDAEIDSTVLAISLPRRSNRRRALKKNLD